MELRRAQHDTVTLVEGKRGPIRFAFTERTGGVSKAPYASLNLGTHVGDDPEAVAENRRRVLAALGAEEDQAHLIVPNQVHGDTVVAIDSDTDEKLAWVRDRALEGADAIVCTAPGVPVLLCFADCVPVVLTAPGGFAVIHSGWKGTFSGIAGAAARVLAEAAGCAAHEIDVVIGPHILGDEYEVSVELMERFASRFPGIDAGAGRLLDLSYAIRASLVDAGVEARRIVDPQLSTMRENDRFFSYRAEGGVCGRHGAVAYMARG